MRVAPKHDLLCGGIAKMAEIDVANSPNLCPPVTARAVKVVRSGIIFGNQREGVAVKSLWETTGVVRDSTT